MIRNWMGVGKGSGAVHDDDKAKLRSSWKVPNFRGDNTIHKAASSVAIKLTSVTVHVRFFRGNSRFWAATGC